MKNKYRFIVPLTAILVVFAQCLNGVAFAAEGEEGAGDEESQVAYPYTHTFSISAYYSPLPGQYHYVNGS